MNCQQIEHRYLAALKALTGIGMAVSRYEDIPAHVLAERVQGRLDAFSQDASKCELCRQNGMSA